MAYINGNEAFIAVEAQATIVEAYVVSELGDSTELVVSQKTVNQVNQRVERNNKRITNLERGIAPNPFITDDSIAYAKNVPSGALPYAEISKVGGMAHRSGDTLKSAKVTAIKSEGANLLNINKDVYNANNCSIRKENGYFIVSVTGSDPFWRFGDSKLGLTNGDYYFYAEATNGAYVQLWDENGSKVTNKGWFTVNDNSVIHFEHEGYSNGRTDVVKIAIYKAEINEFIPYINPIIITIPEAVQSLADYGEGVNETYYNLLDFENKKYIKRVKKRIFTGNENWTSGTSSQTGGFVAIIEDFTDVNVSFNDVGLAISNKYDFNSVATDVDQTFRYNSYAGKKCYFYDSSIATLDEWRAKLATDYVNGNPLTIVYVIKEFVETDLTAYITADNFIGVEGGGTLTFVNTNGVAVPSEITYQVMEA